MHWDIDDFRTSVPWFLNAIVSIIIIIIIISGMGLSP
jgi:hypothetical protein